MAGNHQGRGPRIPAALTLIDSDPNSFSTFDGSTFGPLPEEKTPQF
jgi:hypothetical protein